MPVDLLSGGPKVSPAERTVMVWEIPDKHILDTSAWNQLFDDPDRALLVEKLDTKNIVPTSIAISEISAIMPSSRAGKSVGASIVRVLSFTTRAYLSPSAVGRASSLRKHKRVLMRSNSGSISRTRCTTAMTGGCLL
jgi:hypothetical protein